MGNMGKEVTIRVEGTLEEMALLSNVTVKADPSVPFQEPSQRRRRRKNKNTKRKSGQWNPNDHWGNQKSYPPPGPSKKKVVHTLIDYSFNIPPIPAQENHWDPDFVNYFNYKPEDTPVRTPEEQQRNAIAFLRSTPIFENRTVILPKYIPCRVDFIGMSKRGTVFIKFTDERNLLRFRDLEQRIHMWFIIQNKWNKIDTRIQLEDVKVGLIVLAKISKPEDSALYVRAKITEVKGAGVYISGVDDLIDKWLHYDCIYYLPTQLSGCPFQLVECHLKGLGDWEKTFPMRVIFQRMVDIVLLGRRGHYWVTEFKKEAEKNIVTIDFPSHVAKDLSLNKCVLDQLENFDFRKDCCISP
ncbi:hypothetical protein Ocin01_02171 [Orchesella cincta]|uniref:Tudor domain-containing protein n=1 Tax=Orchesella cincta TaxID=48709 RepID=A0A1D2NGS5_ORCCI|nr:hypothetical protein Ocin01_02171 [Orchesella cincta]